MADLSKSRDLVRLIGLPEEETAELDKRREGNEGPERKRRVLTSCSSNAIKHTLNGKNISTVLRLLAALFRTSHLLQKSNTPQIFKLKALGLHYAERSDGALRQSWLCMLEMKPVVPP